LVCKIGKIEEISWSKNIKIMDVRKGLLDGEYLRKRVIEEYGFEKFRQKVKRLLKKSLIGA